MTMEFFGLVEEQAALLASANQERPMQAVAQVFSDPAGRYAPLELSESRICDTVRHPEVDIWGVRLYLRDASLPGGFVYRPHPNPAKELEISVTGSLCVEWWLSHPWDGRLVCGSAGIPSREWYEDAGLDPSVPRRLYQFLARKVRLQFPYRAVPVVQAQAVARGVRARPSGIACVSPGAARFREEGGLWEGQGQRLEYVPLADVG